MANLHTVDLPIHAWFLNYFDYSVNLGLTNTNIADANTLAGLQSAITGLANVHETHQPILARASAMVQKMADYGSLTTAEIAPLTTTAGLKAEITEEDSGIAALNTDQNFATIYP